jgi:GNAT superfamily N-acetyltransferase
MTGFQPMAARQPFCAGTADGRRDLLKELYVRESARRAGVASRLIDHLRTVAADRPGCTRVEWVTDRDNASARAFYRALGVPEFGGKVFYRLDGDALRP